MEALRKGTTWAVGRMEMATSVSGQWGERVRGSAEAADGAGDEFKGPGRGNKGLS